MSPASSDIFYRRGFDHLKTIARTLQNLRGAGALAHELMQNADDAAHATELTFRFARTGLEVLDNGGFESCGHLSEQTCPWELERRRRKGKKRCDFHGFQQLAGASKENDPSLTGAFGVGFLSVYQVTDTPELFSAGQHWIIDETRREDQRIRGCSGCGRAHIADGTRFWLPWADHASPMREQLATDPVPASTQEQLYREFCEAVPRAMVFLHKLCLVTVEHHSHPPRQFHREPTDDGVRIVGDGRDEHWLVIEGDFHEEAEHLRAEHPQIGDRHSGVRVAVLPGGRVKGLLHATLPTQILTGLPVHVDASFFPRIDRKGILLEGHEGEWNRAAIECAAELVADELETLATALGPKGIWRLIRDAYAGRNRGRRGAGDSLGVFWDQIRRALPDARVMPTTLGDWAAVNETVLPGRKDPPEWLGLLDDIGIHTVAQSVRRAVAEIGRAVPTAALDLHLLVDGLCRVGLDEGPFARAALPAGLASERRRNLLRRRLSSLVAAEPDIETDRVRSLALWRTTRRTYDSLAASYLVERDSAHLFGPVIEYPLVDIDAQDRACDELLALGDRWGTDAGLKALAEDDRVLPADRARAREVLEWLTRRLSDLDAAQIGKLEDRPLIPTSLGLRAAAVSVIPGGFKDPLGVAAEVDSDIVVDLGQILAALGVTRLSFASYVVDFVPTALEQGVTTPALLRLLEVCADHRGDIDADPSLRAALSRESWIACRDRYRRSPPTVYFDTPSVRTVLGEGAAFIHEAVPATGGAADLLKALGAQSEPRPEDVIAHVRELTSESPNPARIDAVASILEYVQNATADADRFAALRSEAWLPADDGQAWAAPTSLYFTRERHLFATTGRFVALPRKEQDALRPALSELGVRQTPAPALVVAHLLNLVTADQPVDQRLVAWLDADRHWDDDAVDDLRDRAWLATASGERAAPSEVFRYDHPLTPYLPVLDPSLRSFTSLLDALDVRAEPTADDAVELLLRLTRDGTDPLTAERRRVIRACWRRIDLDTVTTLDRLIGARVALGADGELYRCDELLLNDLPSVGQTFGAEVQARLVRQSEADAALREVGMRALSECVRSRITATGVLVDSDRVAQRIRSRQAQLARIVGRDGGKWADVLELARTLEVTAYESVTVERYLDEFPDLAPTAPTDVTAHYLGDGRLVVAIKDNRPDWFEIASCLRDVLFPTTASPAIVVAIEEVLAAGSGTDADRRVSRLGYAELDQEHWDELQTALEEQRARAEAAARDAEPADEFDHTDDLDDAEDLIDEHEAHHEPVTEVAGDLDQVSEPNHAGTDEPADADRVGVNAATAHNDEPDSPNVGADEEPQNGHRRDALRVQPHDRQNGRRRAPRSGHAGSAGGDPRDTGHGDGRGSGTAPPAPGRGRRPVREGHEWWYSVVSARKPASDPTDIDVHRQAGRRTAIDAAGMAAVVEYESAAGRHPEPQEPNNPGFDIDSTNAAGETLRYIEVKSLAGEWGSGGFPKLTPTQWTMALSERDMYWLYVVEYAESPDPVITRIQDAAGAVTRYVVDPGWRALGEPEPREPDRDDDDLELVDEAVRDLCLAVMQAGAPTPAILLALGAAGVVVEAAWPQQAVALVSPGSAAAVEGWTLVRSDEIDAAGLLAILHGAK